MYVKALEKGFYNDQLREEGAVFELADAEKDFSKAWMVETDAPSVKADDSDDDDDDDDDDGVKISKAARELAEDAGLDVSTLSGSGKDGAITKGDVTKAIAAMQEMQTPGAGDDA